MGLGLGLGLGVGLRAGLGASLLSIADCWCMILGDRVRLPVHDTRPKILFSDLNSRV